MENKIPNHKKKQEEERSQETKAERKKEESRKSMLRKDKEIHKYISNYSWVKLDRKSSISSLVWPREVVNLLISSSTPREVVELLIYSSTPKELVEPLISVKLQEK